MSGVGAPVSLWDRLLGEALLVARRRRADAELAAAFPTLGAGERTAIARRSAQLQARLRRERFAERPAVRLCRDLALDGAEALQRLRVTPAKTVAVITAPFGAPELALRAVRLYAGNAERVVHVLPMASRGEERTEFLGHAIACSDDWLEAPQATLFPVFGLLEPEGRARVVFDTALPVSSGRGAATRVALAAIEAAVRARPEAWPWGARRDTLRVGASG